MIMLIIKIIYEPAYIQTTSCRFDIKITEIHEMTAKPVLRDSYAFVVFVCTRLKLMNSNQKIQP